MEQIKTGIIVLLVVFLVVAAVIIWLQNREMHGMIDGLMDMVQNAIDGTFKETIYDESKMSALQSKLHQFLVSASYTEEHLAKERDKIKTLISDISHQTKTPIANLMLYGQLLEESELPEEARQIAKQINIHAEKLDFLIKALMKTSRMETGIISVCPKKNQVSQLVREVCRQAWKKAEEKGMILQVEETEVQAVFDAKWTVEAVYNIVDNAIKYSPKCGKVKIKTIEYDGFCRIDVADNGPGIAENELGQIFKRFYRSPEVSETEGVGIGLFLAREVIAAQGGYMKVKSSREQGSVFSVFLSKY